VAGGRPVIYFVVAAASNSAINRDRYDSEIALFRPPLEAGRPFYIIGMNRVRPPTAGTYVAGEQRLLRDYVVFSSLCFLIPPRIICFWQTTQIYGYHHPDGFDAKGLPIGCSECLSWERPNY